METTLATVLTIEAVPETAKKKKLKQRNRQGSGCVYRPKYKDGAGKICEGRWRIKFTYTDPRTGQKQTCNELVENASSQTAASVYLKQRMAEKASGQTDRAAETLRYEDLRAAVLTDYELNNRKSLTTRADGTKTIENLERLDAEFTGRAAVSIATSDVEALKLKLRRDGFANGTVNRTVSLLGRMFSIAEKSRLLREDEMPAFDKLEEGDAREGFVELEDFIRLRRELPEHARTLATMGFYTGMRWGEIVNLRWDSVDLKRAVLRLEPGTTKNRQPRTIPLMGELPEMLKGERLRYPGAKHVFAHDGSTPIRTIRKAWIGASIRAGLGRWAWACGKRGCDGFDKPFAEYARKDKAVHRCVTCGQPGNLKYFGLLFHDLRRTGVRNLVRAGVPESVAMKISGHKTRTVFERYNIYQRTGSR